MKFEYNGKEYEAIPCPHGYPCKNEDCHGLNYKKLSIITSK